MMKMSINTIILLIILLTIIIIYLYTNYKVREGWGSVGVAAGRVGATTAARGSIGASVKSSASAASKTVMSNSDDFARVFGGSAARAGDDITQVGATTAAKEIDKAFAFLNVGNVGDDLARGGVNVHESMSDMARIIGAKYTGPGEQIAARTITGGVTNLDDAGRLVTASGKDAENLRLIARNVKSVSGDVTGKAGLAAQQSAIQQAHIASMAASKVGGKEAGQKAFTESLKQSLKQSGGALTRGASYMDDIVRTGTTSGITGGLGRAGAKFLGAWPKGFNAAWSGLMKVMPVIEVLSIASMIPFMIPPKQEDGSDIPPEQLQQMVQYPPGMMPGGPTMGGGAAYPPPPGMIPGGPTMGGGAAYSPPPGMIPGGPTMGGGGGYAASDGSSGEMYDPNQYTSIEYLVILAQLEAAATEIEEKIESELKSQTLSGQVMVDHFTSAQGEAKRKERRPQREEQLTTGIYNNSVVSMYCDTDKCGNKDNPCSHDDGALRHCRTFRCVTPTMNPNSKKWKESDGGDYVTKRKQKLLVDRHTRLVECYNAQDQNRETMERIELLEKDLTYVNEQIAYGTTLYQMALEKESKSTRSLSVSNAFAEGEAARETTKAEYELKILEEKTIKSKRTRKQQSKLRKRRKTRRNRRKKRRKRRRQERLIPIAS